MRFATRAFFILVFSSTAGNTYAQSFTSSNLPIIVINTNGQTIVDEPKITADMGIILNAGGARNSVTDPFNNYNGKIGIEIRGSTSQDFFPKKQYGIELRDAAGASIDASLLGLPKKDDWVLFAPYDDKSLMRDVLAYKLGRDLGRYASRFKYVELVLNGQYQGIYVLLEKVKRDKNRVSIDKLDPGETTGDALTGGYIIKLDKIEGSGGQGWASTFAPPNRKGQQITFFQYDYPKQEDIVTEQKTYIQSYVNSFETALAGGSFKDPVSGYPKYIDVDSFVDYFIGNELPRNPDAYRLSTFIHKRKDSDGGKLVMGPIWDFNLGFGNVNFCAKDSPEGFIIHYNRICPDDGWLVPFWWDRLFEDDAFKAKVAARWSSLRAGVYQTSRIMGFIDSVATVLNVEAQQRNFQRWPVLGIYVWPNAYIGNTFQDEVNFLKSWTTRRLTWMDENIGNVVTGVEHRPAVDEFAVTGYPNPFKDDIRLNYTLVSPGNVFVELLDFSGRRIESFVRTHTTAGSFESVMQSRNVSPGLYVLKTQFGGTTKLQKMVKIEM
jgi:hypothetical protein